MTEGRKDSAGKPNLHKVFVGFSEALYSVAAVGTYGAEKYEWDNWFQVKDGITEYSSAMQRHYLAQFGDSEYDKESNLLHAAHMAWNALAVLELTLQEMTLRMDNDQHHD